MLLKNFGKKPTEVLPPKEAMHILMLFRSLSSPRRWNEGSPIAVSWQEIVSWLKLFKPNVTVSMVELLQQMDVAWCNAVSQEQSYILKRENK